MTLRELAARLECALEGDGDIEIRGVAGIDAAGPGDLTFFANRKYRDRLRTTRASAVIAGRDASDVPCAVLRTEDPSLAFARALSLFAETWRPAAGIHPQAHVEAGVSIAPDASIGAFCFIGEGTRIGARTVLHSHVAIGRFAEIGDDCIVHSHAAVRERVRIGNRVILQNGVVAGSDGYGFVRRRDGTHEKIPQIGGLVIEDDVEIGANTTVDRPAVGETRIGAGTKIDNLVQIAHGVRLGRHVLLAAQVGIAGSTVIEDQVTLAGQVGVAGHLTIGKGAIATAQSGIPNSVGAGAFVSGYPAIANREWLKASAVFRNLPELRRLVADLEKRIAELEGEAAAKP